MLKVTEAPRLRDIVRLYEQAIRADVPVAPMIAARLGITSGSARAYLNRARRAGLIPRTPTRRRGEADA